MQITVIFPERNHVQVSFTTKLLLFFFFYLVYSMKFSIWRRKKAKKQFVLYFAKGKKFYYLRKIASLLLTSCGGSREWLSTRVNERKSWHKKEKQRKQSSYSLCQKHFFFADDYAIDKNFKNKKLQLKQKGVRWDECYMFFHCYTLVIANNSGNKKMLECWIITLQTCYNIFTYVWSSNSISKQFFRNYCY